MVSRWVSEAGRIDVFWMLRIVAERAPQRRDRLPQHTLAHELLGPHAVDDDLLRQHLVPLARPRRTAYLECGLINTLRPGMVAVVQTAADRVRMTEPRITPEGVLKALADKRAEG